LNSANKQNKTQLTMMSKQITYEFKGEVWELGLFQRLPTTYNHSAIPITLSAEFKAVGTVPSTLYFGMAHYKKDGSIIPAHENFRIEEPVTIKSIINDTAQYKGFVIDKKPGAWYANSSIGYHRALGIYLDGNIDKPADFVLFQCTYDTGPTVGAFFMDNDGQVNLNMSFPDNISAAIVPGVSKLMNHLSSGTYHYCAASGVDVPLDGEWHRYTATLVGEGWNSPAGKHRIGAVEAGMVIGANYRQKSDAVLQMRNPIFTMNAQLLK